MWEVIAKIENSPDEKMETIEDPLIKKIRQLDKLVDELANGGKDSR